MLCKLFRLLSFLPLTAAAAALAQGAILLSGPVTDPGTPAEFTVNAVRIHCTPSTVNVLFTHGSDKPVHGCPVRVLGESLTIRGERNRATLDVTARKITSEGFDDNRVDGFAVIDRLITPAAAEGNVTVGADGYVITLTAATRLAFLDPLTDKTPIAANLWLRFSGVQHPDGSVTATVATFTPNILKDRERKANTKFEFDASAVTEEDKQGSISKLVLGVDPRRFPATHDALMQQRVDLIGQKLIPAYQREMAPDNLAKVNFRFQVVNQPKLHDARTLSNGIILVPEQVVARLENDAQLATILADNIACALEKQTLREIPAREAMTAADVATAAAGVVLPGVGIATLATELVANSKILKHEEEQSGRVSLALLHNAGFDVAEAPKTWWLLAPSHPKPLSDIEMPYRTHYLYGMLATTWRSTTETSKVVAARDGDRHASAQSPASGGVEAKE